MRWTPGDRGDIDDARGRSGLGVRGGVPLSIGGVVVLLFLSWATGTDFLSLLGTQSGVPSQTATPGQVTSTPQEERIP